MRRGRQPHSNAARTGAWNGNASIVGRGGGVARRSSAHGRLLGNVNVAWLPGTGGWEWVSRSVMPVRGTQNVCTGSTQPCVTAFGTQPGEGVAVGGFKQRRL